MLCTEQKDNADFEQPKPHKGLGAANKNKILYIFFRIISADKQGEKPADDMPVDQRDQIYGTYTATMGNLKLLYSVEIPGVDNTEMLDDL